MITRDFSYSEFRPYGTPKTWMPGTPMKKLMIETLALSLQTTRDFIEKMSGKGYPITITSGVRTESDYDRLISKGYKPSKTSDHYYGNPVHPLSSGAVDIISPGIDTEVLFDIMKTLATAGEINVGQLILETQGDTSWVHCGNNLVHIMDRAGQLGILRNCKFHPFIINN